MNPLQSWKYTSFKLIFGGWWELGLGWRLWGDVNPIPSPPWRATGPSKMLFLFPQEPLVSLWCWHMCCPLPAPPPALSLCFPLCLPWDYVAWGCLNHRWYWDAMKKSNSESLWVLKDSFHITLILLLLGYLALCNFHFSKF